MERLPRCGQHQLGMKRLWFTAVWIVGIMKRLSSILLAASSLLWPWLALAAERPHYGGILHVELRESPASLDPAMLFSTAPQSLARLVFETLVEIDENGRLKPLLASSWQAEPGNQRWRFHLRGGVCFSDGAPLDAAAVVASLRNSSTDWRVLPDGDSVIIETEAPDSEIPAELALVHHAVVRRSDSKLAGTGPFAMLQWTPGQHLNLKANDAYWGGRPFLDSVDVEFDKNDREQMMALDLGRADVVQVAPENLHRTEAQNRTVLSSQPSELVALVFANQARSDDEIH